MLVIGHSLSLVSRSKVLHFPDYMSRFKIKCHNYICLFITQKSVMSPPLEGRGVGKECTKTEVRYQKSVADVELAEGPIINQ